MPAIFTEQAMVGTRSLPSGAHSRDPVAQPTLHIADNQRRRQSAERYIRKIL